MNRIKDELSLDLQNICRLCLKTSAVFQSIFDDLEGDLKYSDLIVLFAPVAIYVNDGLPDKICNSCKDSLALLHNLRYTCVKSDTWLREKLNDKIKQEDFVALNEIAKNENQYKCEHYDVVFSNEDCFEVHTKDHANEIAKNENQYKCEHCDEVFSNEDCFEVHTKDHANDFIDERHHNDANDIDSDDVPLIQCKKNGKRKSYTCEVCNKDFPSRHAITRHSNVHNNAKGKKFKCEECHIYLTTRRTLLRHRKIHLKPESNKQYACLQCDGKTFKNQKSYASHMRIHKMYYETKENTTDSDQEEDQSSDEEINESDKPPKMKQLKRVFKCKDCFRVFEKQPSLASHVRVHKENITKKEYICDICNQKFIAYIFLTRHWKCHPEKKIHKCNMCDEAFVLGDQLDDHLNKHNGVRPYECNTCDKKFYSNETLRKHRNVHKPNHKKDKIERLCPHCGKVFSNNTVLRQHLNTHSDTKPFACDQCPSRFVSKRYLKKHVKTHAGLKPHICDECGNAFAKKSSLVKHKRIHTGEKPYACTNCDKRFNSSENLKRHIRIHTGEKPYKCKFCDRAFAQSSELTGHTRKHLGDNIYQCEKCPAAFRLHGELREHTRMHFLAEKETKEATAVELF